MSSDVYFCIFCDDKYFFKKELKDHVIKRHQKKNESGAPLSEGLNDIIDFLTTYCSALESTLGSTKTMRKSRSKKYLPEDNVSELLIGCCFCDRIIKHYELKTFDRNAKPAKDMCVCGETIEDDYYHLVTCAQCQHTFHFECLETDEYSDKDWTQYECNYCREMSFAINTINDMKPLHRIKHFRQHLNYSPYKCKFNGNCDQKFFTHPLFLDHWERHHKSEGSKEQLFTYESIIEIDDLFEGKGMLKEIDTSSNLYTLTSLTPNIAVNSHQIDESTEQTTDRNDVTEERDIKPVIISENVVNDITSELCLPSTSSAIQSTSVPNCDTHLLNGANSSNTNDKFSNKSNESNTTRSISNITSISNPILKLRMPAIEKSPNPTKLTPKTPLFKVPKVMRKKFEDYPEYISIEILKIETEEPDEKKPELYSKLSERSGLSVDNLKTKANSLIEKWISNLIEKKMEKIHEMIDAFIEEQQNSETLVKQSTVDLLSERMKGPMIEALDCKRKEGIRKNVQDLDKYEDQLLERIREAVKKIDSKLHISDNKTLSLKTNPENKSVPNSEQTLTTNSAIVERNESPAQKTKENQMNSKSISNELISVSNNQQKANLNNYTIPHNKLPNDLTQNLKTYIKSLIDFAAEKRELNEEESTKFDELVQNIESECRPLMSSDQTARTLLVQFVRTYLASNLKHLKQIYLEKSRECELKIIEKESEDMLTTLKITIDQLKPEVTKVYNEKVKEFEENQTNKGIQPEVQMPRKTFPFPDEIIKCLKNLVALRTEFFEITFADDPNLKIKDLLYDYFQYQVLKLWPEGWMKNERLLQKIKPLVKQKTAKTLTQNTEQPKSPLPADQPINCEPIICDMSSTIISPNLLIPSTSQSQPIQSNVQNLNTNQNNVSTSLNGSKADTDEPPTKKTKTGDKTSLNSKEIIDKSLVKVFGSDSNNTTDKVLIEGIASFESRYNLRNKSNQNLNQSSNEVQSEDKPEDEELIDQFIRWTTQYKLIKFPYLPQLNDKVAYLRSGHTYYLNKLKEKKLIPSTNRNFKVRKSSIPQFKDNEVIFAIVRKISFESKPFLSIKLQLEEEDPQSGEPLEELFEVQYMNLEEVPDFLILRCQYENSLDIAWKVGDSIRTMKLGSDHWVNGVIVKDESPKEVEELFPSSLFQKYEVNIDVGNWTTRLSHWELELRNELNDKETDITEDHRLAIYNPEPQDWPKCHIENIENVNVCRDFERQSLIRAFDQMIGREEVCPFVIVNHLFPETKPIYRIDLSLIQQRIANNFYRRSKQIKFDFEMIEENIKTFYPKNDFTLILHDFQKFRRVFENYMDIDLWERNGDKEENRKDILQLFLQEFTPNNTIDNDSDIEMLSNEDMYCSNSSNQSLNNQTQNSTESGTEVKTIDSAKPSNEEMNDSSQPNSSQMSTNCENPFISSQSTQTDISFNDMQTQTDTTESNPTSSSGIPLKCRICETDWTGLDCDLNRAFNHFKNHGMSVNNCIRELCAALLLPNNS